MSRDREDLEVRGLALWGEHSSAEVEHREDDHEKGDDGAEAHRAKDRLLVKWPGQALLVAERKEDKQADQRRPEAEQERHLVRFGGELAVADRGESEGRKDREVERVEDGLVHPTRDRVREPQRAGQERVALDDRFIGRGILEHVLRLAGVLSGLAEPFAKRPKQLVQRGAAGAIVALEFDVMKVVELIRLEVVLPARVARRRRDEEVDAIPHHHERAGVNVKGRSHAREVVQVLDWVHTKPGKRLDVRVPVVQTVNILVQE